MVEPLPELNHMAPTTSWLRNVEVHMNIQWVFFVSNTDFKMHSHYTGRCFVIEVSYFFRNWVLSRKRRLATSYSLFTQVQKMQTIQYTILRFVITFKLTYDFNYAVQQNLLPGLELPCTCNTAEINKSLTLAHPFQSLKFTSCGSLTGYLHLEVQNMLQNQHVRQ